MSGSIGQWKEGLGTGEQWWVVGVVLLKTHVDWITVGLVGFCWFCEGWRGVRWYWVGPMRWGYVVVSHRSVVLAGVVVAGRVVF